MLAEGLHIAGCKLAPPDKSRRQWLPDLACPKLHQPASGTVRKRFGQPASDLVIEERRVLGMFKQKPPLRRQTEINAGHGGYHGPKFSKALRKIRRNIDIEIVKRSDLAKGFVVLPRRWVAERTIAWLNRCRRLAKDWECQSRNGLTFLRWASVRIMLRKLCKGYE
jgi:hypothetical protein